MATDTHFVDKLARLKAIDIAIDEMLLAFTASKGLQEYTLDTGQARQEVRRADLTQWRLYQKNVIGQITTLEARTCGTGVLNVRGSW